MQEETLGRRRAASKKKRRYYFNIIYKGSAWVPPCAGTHAPGRAGQHFDLFDLIFDRVKTVTTQHILYACRTQSNAKRWIYYRLTVDYLPLLSFPPFLRFLRQSDSERHHIYIFRSDKSEPMQTDPLVWPRRDASSAFLDVSTQRSIQGRQRDGQMFCSIFLRSN